MALSPNQVRDKVLTLRTEYAARDGRYTDIAMIRGGRAQDVRPDMFPEAWPAPIVANFCDVAARDLAELIAPLPAFNCSSASMVSDTAKKFADKRTKIVHNFLQTSKIGPAMYRGADWYITYGMLPFVVEPDFKSRSPKIRLEDPTGSYPEFDRFGTVISFTKVTTKPAHVVASEYPELADKIIRMDVYGVPLKHEQIEIVHYSDDSQFLTFLPQRNSLVLSTMPNMLGKCPVRVAVRPGLDSEIRGQFDDVKWIQLAKARMAVLGLEAAEKSVQAPIALPNDVQEMSFGPDSILRSANPEKIRRVGIEMSPAALQEESVLESELRVGGRYPEARSGVQDASVITGRGIQELMGGFDTQIKSAQEILRDTFREVIALCLEMDQKFWGGTAKDIRGEVQGAPYTVSYDPAKDIKGDYTCDVTYGLAAGMDPNRWLVFMLQLRGDRLVPREFVQRNLPMDVNVTQLQTQLDVEESRDAVKQAAFGLAQAVPQLVAQGMNPSQVMLPFVTLIQKLQKGDTFESAAMEAWAPPPAPPESPDLAADQQEPSAGGPGQPGGPPPTMNQLTPGVAPGQAGMGQGGRANLQYLLAGLSGSSGNPVLSASTVKRLPAG